MATPRSAYIVLADSIWDEPWESHHELVATMALLSVHMHRRWRSDRRLTVDEVGREHHIAVSDLYRITGKRRADIARKSLERLAEFLTMSVEHRGDITVISWPKWAEYHKVDARYRGQQQPQQQPQQQKSSRRGPRRGGKAATVASPMALRMADLLASLLREREAPAQFTGAWRKGWAYQIQRLADTSPDMASMDSEQREKYLEAGIRWSQSEENLDQGKYALVIHSGQALRDKWPRLVAAAKRARCSQRRVGVSAEEILSRMEGATHG